MSQPVTNPQEEGIATVGAGGQEALVQNAAVSSSSSSSTSTPSSANKADEHAFSGKKTSPPPSDPPPQSPAASRENALCLLRHILKGTVARWDQIHKRFVFPEELRQLLDDDLLLVLPYLLQWMKRLKKNSQAQTELKSHLASIFQVRGELRGPFLRQQIYLLARAGQVPFSGGAIGDFREFFDDANGHSVVGAPSKWEQARDEVLRNQDASGLEIQVPGGLKNPLAVGVTASIAKIKVIKKFGSANAPVLIDLIYEDRKLNPFRAILKSNDVVARDYFVQNMFRLMNALWQDAYGGAILQHGLLPEAVTYRIALIGQMNAQLQCDGLIECAEGFDLLDRQEELDQVFKTYNDDCWNTLLRTLAGGAVAGYLLGVADRHYENMRLAQDPTTEYSGLVHIIVHRILEQLRNQPQKWDQFIDLSVRAFIIMRKNCSILLDYAGSVFANIEDSTEIQRSMVQHLKLDREETDAIAAFLRRLENQPLSLATFTKRISHEITPCCRRAKRCQWRGIHRSIEYRFLCGVTAQFVFTWSTFVSLCFIILGAVAIFAL